MGATLFWTICDFPRYAMLSGLSTKRFVACPSCQKDTCSFRLKHDKKQCYMGRRRFLPLDKTFELIKSFFVVKDIGLLLDFL